jgi:hypothetical protein
MMFNNLLENISPQSKPVNTGRASALVIASSIPSRVFKETQVGASNGMDSAV